jgi:hypothetical protein
MEKDLADFLLLRHFEEGVEMAEVGVDASVAAESHEVKTVAG